MRAWNRLVGWTWSAARVVVVYRLSLGLSVGLAITLAYPDQAIEALLVLAEDSAAGSPQPLLAFGITLILASLCLWFWARTLGIRFCDRTFHKKIDGHFLAVQLPRVCGILPSLGVAIGFWMARRLSVGSSLSPDQAARLTNLGGRGPGAIWLGWLVAAALGLSVCLYVGFVLRRSLLNRAMRTASPGSPTTAFEAELGHSSTIVLRIGFVLAVTLLIMFTLRPLWAVHIGPLAVVCLAIAVWGTLGNALVWLGHLWRFPPLTVVVAFATTLSLANCNDNHVIRMSTSAQRSVPTEFGGAFQEWLKCRPDRDRYDSYPVVIVSAEGGGIYAAYFTSMLLSTLQDVDPSFSQHVFAISGVSGGSVGATCFVAGRSLADSHSVPALPPASDLSRNCLRRDLLSPVLAMMLFPDLIQRIWPWPVAGFDRALGLELGLEEGWREASGQNLPSDFYALWPDFPRGTAPALFLNTTEVEVGRRMVISSLYPLDERFNYLYSFADINPRASMPASTAACLSARFPYVTPVGTIPYGSDANGNASNHPRFADGGYFDNSATITLSEMLASLHSGEDGYPRFTPIVLRIGTAPADRAKGPVEPDRLKFATRGLGETLSPVRTLLNARGGRSDIAVHQLHSAITTLLDRKVYAEVLDFELDTEPTSIPLGWLLSERSRKEIERQIGKPRNAGTTIGVENDANMGRVLQLLKPNR